MSQPDPCSGAGWDSGKRKRSLSASACSGYKVLPPLLQRTCSVLAVLDTPFSKMSVARSVVTPKFNPKRPVVKTMRRPRAGEVVMSFSGSPLLNFVDKIPDKRVGVSVSLGDGKAQRPSAYQKMELSANPYKEAVEAIENIFLSAKKNGRTLLDKLPLSPFKVRPIYSPKEMEHDMKRLKQLKLQKTLPKSTKVIFTLNVEESSPIRPSKDNTEETSENTFWKESKGRQALSPASTPPGSPARTQSFSSS